ITKIFQGSSNGHVLSTYTGEDRNKFVKTENENKTRPMKKSPSFPSFPFVQSSRFNGSTVQCFLSSLALALTPGCQLLSYTSPPGDHFTRSSIGANTSIQSLALEAGTNGVRRLELRGYNNDNSQALGAVTEAAVRAALQSAK